MCEYPIAPTTFYSCIARIFPEAEKSFVDISAAEHLLQRSEF